MSDSHSSSETVATLKLLLIGSSGTGKSSLLMRFVDGVFLAPDEISATIGVDFKVKVIDVEGKKYKLTIWVGRHSVSLLLTSPPPSAFTSPISSVVLCISG
jgi:GTPase SAR1 family protein